MVGRNYKVKALGCQIFDIDSSSAEMMLLRKSNFSLSLCDIPGIIKLTCKAFFPAFVETVGREMWDAVSANFSARCQP